MRRLLLALFVTLTLAGGASQAAPIDWNQDPYYDGGNHELLLATRPDWKGGTSRGNVDGFTDYRTHNGHAPEYLWGATCEPGAQIVTFTREVVAPGDAAKLEGSVGIVSDLGANVIVSVDVMVNGQRVFTTDQDVHKRPFIGERAFKYGKNIVTVKVQKKKTAPCDTKRIGVYVFMYAKFVAEVEVKATVPPRGELSSPKFEFEFDIVNNGPSTLAQPPGGSFYFQTTLSSRITTEDFPTGLLVRIDGDIQAEKKDGVDDGTCTFFPSSGSVGCALGEMPPGKSISVVVIFGVKAPAGNFKFAFENTWVAGGMNDAKIGNHQGKDKRLVCNIKPSHPNKCAADVKPGTY